MSLLDRLELPIWVLPAAALVAGAVPGWYFTRLYYRADIAEMREAQALALNAATAAARAKDKENARLASEADLANMEKRNAIDEAADALRESARLNGLRVKVRPSNCVSGTATDTSVPENTTPTAKLSEDVAGRLINRSKLADTAASYAADCRDWALRITQP